MMKNIKLKIIVFFVVLLSLTGCSTFTHVPVQLTETSKTAVIVNVKEKPFLISHGITIFGNDEKEYQDLDESLSVHVYNLLQTELNSNSNDRVSLFHVDELKQKEGLFLEDKSLSKEQRDADLYAWATKNQFDYVLFIVDGLECLNTDCSRAYSGQALVKMPFNNIRLVSSFSYSLFDTSTKKLIQYENVSSGVKVRSDSFIEQDQLFCMMEGTLTRLLDMLDITPPLFEESEYKGVNNFGFLNAISAKCKA